MIDAYELIGHLCNLDEDADYEDVHDALYEKYEIDLHNFEKIIEDLLPLIDVGVSPFTGAKFKGFAVVKNGHGLWLVKTAVRSACDESGDTHE